jgi:toxin ParE1/3/4
VKAGQRRHTVRLAQSAEDDYRAILLWTAERFGQRQALAYARTISEALEAVRGGSSAVGAKRRDDIAPGLFVIHVARNRRKGRHVILFRANESQDGSVAEVLRILHDSMDIVRHL